jgi:hypothetical protein
MILPAYVGYRTDLISSSELKSRIIDRKLHRASVTERRSVLPPARGVRDMVTTQDMRVFSLECLKWADETSNPNDRALMLRVAHLWMGRASAIDREVVEGGEVAEDLRVKLA